jgi:hypothetical protein
MSTTEKSILSNSYVLIAYITYSLHFNYKDTTLHSINFPHQSWGGFFSFTNAKAQALRPLQSDQSQSQDSPQPNLDQIPGTDNCTGWAYGSGQALLPPAVL